MPSGYNANLPNDMIWDVAVLSHEVAAAQVPLFATRGGNAFNKAEEHRQVPYDGARVPVAGLDRKVGAVPAFQGTALQLDETLLALLEPASTTATVAGPPPVVQDAFAQLLNGTLVDHMVEDIRTLRRVNRLAESSDGGVKSPGGREYRIIEHLFAGPGPGQIDELGLLANNVLTTRFSGVRALGYPDLRLLSFMLGPSSSRGELLSFACAACHTLRAGEKTLIGPNLHGVFGRPAASVAGFEYSAALRGSGLVWTPRALDAWLADPQRFVPGTTMAFTGLHSADDRRDLIAFLLRVTN